MTKRYVEVTIAFEDDPVVNPTGTLEVASREKEGEAGDWIESEPSEYVPSFVMYFPWLELEVKKV